MLEAMKLIWHTIKYNEVVIQCKSQYINTQYQKHAMDDEMNDVAKMIFRGWIRTTECVAGCQATRRKMGHIVFGFNCCYGGAVYALEQKKPSPSPLGGLFFFWPGLSWSVNFMKTARNTSWCYRLLTSVILWPMCSHASHITKTLYIHRYVDISVACCTIALSHMSCHMCSILGARANSSWSGVSMIHTQGKGLTCTSICFAYVNHNEEGFDIRWALI